MNVGIARGLKLTVGRWRFRLWLNGFEWGNRFGGRVYFFPWHPYWRRRD